MLKERRIYTEDFEVRSEGDKTIIQGYAAKFNTRSQNLGGFVEQISPGAFAKTIQEADIRALLNHDSNLVLGRNKAGTLQLQEDGTGLAYRVTLPDTSYAHDLAENLRLGNISQSSFQFRTIKDDWGLTEDDFPLRTLKEVHLLDVSPVTYPAYLDTEVGLSARAAIDKFAEQRGFNADQLDAFLRGETGKVQPEFTTATNQSYRDKLTLLRLRAGSKPL